MSTRYFAPPWRFDDVATGLRDGAPLSSMTSIAKRLERKGLIARATSAQDQRVKLVTLTQEGLRLAKEWEQIMMAMLSRLETAFTPEEMEQFTTLLFKATRVFQDGDL